MSIFGVSNYLRVFFHCAKGNLNGEHHYMTNTYISNEKHWYCTCGFDKPKRIHVRIDR